MTVKLEMTLTAEEMIVLDDRFAAVQPPARTHAPPPSPPTRSGRACSRR